MDIRKIIREELKKVLSEDITIPINIGDEILTGRFKNKKTIVKTIDVNEKGDITINNKSILKIRTTSK